MSVKTFIISFLDGFTGAGTFGDLRRPGAPDRLFEEEPDITEQVGEGGEPDEQKEPRRADEGSETT